MLQAKIKVKDHGFIKRTKASPAIIEAEGRTFLETALGFIERMVKIFTPVGVIGALRGSIFTTNLTGTFKNLTGSVTTPSEYALPAEEGTKPHMPPVDPLILWVRRKGLTTGILLSRLQGGGREGEERKIAWAIAMKIKKEGTKGAHMFRRALEKSQTFVGQERDAYAKRVADRITNG